MADGSDWKPTTKRAPASRNLSRRAKPVSSALPNPAMSTISLLPDIVDLAVVQACSSSTAEAPARSPKRTNLNVAGASCW